MQTSHTCLFVYAISIVAYVEVADASLAEYTSFADWSNQLSTFTTIDFTTLSNGTIVSNQFASLGAIFTDGTDLVTTNPEYVDGHGLRGGTTGFADDIHIDFDSPQYAIAADYPGAIEYELYYQGQFVSHSSGFGEVGGPFFAGIISDRLFDSVRIFDWTDNTVFIDNLYFSSVPRQAPWR